MLSEQAYCYMMQQVVLLIPSTSCLAAYTGCAAVVRLTRNVATGVSSSRRQSAMFGLIDILKRVLVVWSGLLQFC